MRHSLRLRVLFLDLALALFAIMPFVSAVPFFDSSGFDFGSTFDSAKESLSNGLSFLFSTQEIATKTLFAVLLFMIIYTTADAVFKKKWYFTVVVSAIISALAIVWTPDNFLAAVRSNYGAFGVAVLTIIPLLIMLVFTVRVQSSLVGQVLWIFYGIYYFALLLYQTLTGTALFFSIENLPYFGAIIGGALMFLFIPAIRQAIFKGKLTEIKQEGTMVANRAKLLHKLQAEELDAYTDDSPSP